ncbi:hypothetical protein KTR10_02690 [Candidatus Kaiserbacteria bacterium]|nr:hypothetical protein [Candidatus Kaiserbacteria bacterium]
MRELITKPVEQVEKFGVNGGVILAILGIVMVGIVVHAFDINTNAALRFAVAAAPIWLPIITFLLFFEFWMYFVRKEFDLNQGRVVFEVTLPKDVYKSPEAMELVLVQLHQTAAPDNHVQTYWDGKHPPTTSLELVSHGGEVKFYISVPKKKFKNIMEAQLYAQYPGIEVKELEVDYTAEIPWDPDKYAYFSLHFNLKKADAYPLRTYVEYGLHTMPKEEEKVDPITSMVDALANLGPNEWYWVQILIDANREVTFKEGALRKQADWKEAAREEIAKIVDAARKRSGVEEGGNVMQQLTDVERDTIKAIERSLGKNAFNVAIRGMYIATQEAFLPGERIGQLITGWRGYDDLNRNAIGVRWRTDFDWNWWQDPSGKRRMAHKKRELAEYKKRIYLSQNSTDGRKVMTTEELATIFHFPGRVLLTPTVGRIESTRSEAPTNLPV